MKSFFYFLLISTALSRGLSGASNEMVLGDLLSDPASQLGNYYGTKERGSGEIHATVFGQTAVASVFVAHGKVAEITYSFIGRSNGLSKLAIYAHIAGELKKKPTRDPAYEIVRLADIDIAKTAGVGAVVPNCLLSLHLVSETISYQLELKANKIDDLPNKSQLLLRVMYEKDLPKPLID